MERALEPGVLGLESSDGPLTTTCMNRRVALPEVRTGPHVWHLRIVRSPVSLPELCVGEFLGGILAAIL